MPDLTYENAVRGLVAGFDEVGRGSLAGPLVTAGVILPPDFDATLLSEINDSKQIRKDQHLHLARRIYDLALEVRVDITFASEVDKLTINPAVKASMLRVVDSFVNKPDHLLIDGSPWQKLDTDISQETIVKGDTKSLSIACASLVAKFIHDKIMEQLDDTYPEFGFKTNTGYGTKQHIEALTRYGYTPEHRLTYKPLSSGEFKPYAQNNRKAG